MASTTTPTWSTQVDQRAESVTMVPLSRIRTAADNPRKDVGDVSELAESIKQQGVIEPLILTHGEGDTYVIVAGHRRMAAIEKIVKEEPGRLGSAQRHQLAHVPAIIRTYDERARTVVSLVENLQRADLTPIEEAAGYQRLEQAGLSQRAIAEQVGKAQSHVQKRLALLELPAKVQEKVDSGGISIGDALELTRLKDEPKRIEKALKWGGDVAYAVRQQLQEASAEKAITEATASLKKRGVKLLESKQHFDGWFTYNSKDRPLKGQGKDPAIRLAIGVKEHEKQTCHAARITSGGQIVYVCTEPANHAKQDKRAAELSREQKAEKARRDKERAQEKAAKAAAAARLEVLKGLVQKPSAEWLQWAAVRLGETARTEEGRVAVQVAGLVAKPSRYGSPEYGQALAEEARKSVRAAQSVLIALAIGNVEPRIRNADFPGYGGRIDSEGREYLAQLEKAGYKLSEVERKLMKPDVSDTCASCGRSIDEVVERITGQPEEVLDAYDGRSKKESRWCVECWLKSHPERLPTALTAGADGGAGEEEDAGDE